MTYKFVVDIDTGIDRVMQCHQHMCLICAVQKAMRKIMELFA